MSRINVLKTYKIFIGGKFPRTESGRFFPLKNKNSDLVANICLSSRKDFRNAVVYARSSQKKWGNTTALNKGQVLYRIAEILEGRKLQFEKELMMTGSSKIAAKKEIEQSIWLIGASRRWSSLDI